MERRDARFASPLMGSFQTCKLNQFSDDVIFIMKYYAGVSKSQKPTLFCRAIVKNYLTTLYGLRDIHRTTGSRIAKKFLDLWLDLRAELEVERLLHRCDTWAERELAHTRWKACHNKKCVCSAMHPCHSMKVCKGCWHVRYCCRMCQKM